MRFKEGARDSAAARRPGSLASARNSFAGLVETDHRCFEQTPALRAGGDDPSNDAWLSQTVDPPRANPAAKPWTEI